jgi:trk system potassium uptake protein TrkA
MNLLVCGAGKVARHLLKRLGESWRVTLVDKSQDRLESLLPTFQTIQRILTGDASSPVVLDDAGVGDADYVVALTGDDRVNLAVCRYAKERGVKNILALVNDQEDQPKFEELAVRTVRGNVLIAGEIHHDLQDPRINVLPLNLGQGEVMEVDTSNHLQIVGARAAELSDPDWRLVALFRDQRLLFPDDDTMIEASDRLVIVGRPNVYKPVCALFKCGRPHFPLAYGQGLLLGLLPGKDPEGIIRESVHLAQNTKLRSITVLCSESEKDALGPLSDWSHTLDIQVQSAGADLPGQMLEMASTNNFGLVAIEPFEASFLTALARPPLVSLAHSLSRPLLIARHTTPYRRILVPFNASAGAGLGLEIAVDLARQLQAEVAVAVVEEPEVVQGQEGDTWLQSVVKRTREMGHIHKVHFEEIVRRGNPVKEIVELAKDFNLMVMGSTTQKRGLFSPHVGELIAQRAPCSVLIVTG